MMSKEKRKRIYKKQKKKLQKLKTKQFYDSLKGYLK